MRASIAAKEEHEELPQVAGDTSPPPRSLVGSSLHQENEAGCLAWERGLLGGGMEGMGV